MGGVEYNDRYDHYDWGLKMIFEESAVNFRQKLGTMLNQVRYRHDNIIINKDGDQMAALVDMELFSRIRRMRDHFNKLTDRLAAGYANVPESEGLAEIDALVAEERTRHKQSR